MDQYCQHKKVNCSNWNEYYLYTCSAPYSSSMKYNRSEQFIFKDKNMYTVHLKISEEQISFSVCSTSSISLKCSVSLFIGSERLLLSKKLDSEYCNASYCTTHRMILPLDDACIQKLKLHQNDAFVLICRIIYNKPTGYTSSFLTSGSSTTDGIDYLNKLTAAFGNFPKSSWKEKVLLRVGEEFETVSKAVLCDRSSVFAKMFKHDMKEQRSNSVTIPDIEMLVLRALVSFLYSGKLPNYDFDFLCGLYYASDKYDIADLRQICVDRLLPGISKKNVFRALKMAFSHDIERLKSTAITFIIANIDTLISTSDWRNFINDEPWIAVEISKFLDF